MTPHSLVSEGSFVCAPARSLCSGTELLPIGSARQGPESRASTARVVFSPIALPLLQLFFVLPVLVPRFLVLVVVHDRLVRSFSVNTVLVRGLSSHAWYRVTFLVYVVLADRFQRLGMNRSLELNHSLCDL